MHATPLHARPTATAPAACAAWFGARSVEAASLPAIGFSGVPISRVRPVGAPRWFVLKAFSPGTPRDRTEWVHALMRHLAATGIAEVPPPEATSAGATVVTDSAGIHWELVPFVEGMPTTTPSVSQASAAMAVVAKIHRAAATWSGAPPDVGPAPAMDRRVAQARDLAAKPWRDRRAHNASAVDEALVSAIGDRWDRAIALFDAIGGRDAVAAIASARIGDVPRQAVLRDVWSDHVLFASDEPARVAGIVDLHAAGIDTPATDIARLLGSWRPNGGGPAADVVATWPEAVAAYEAIRPLTAVERGLVPFLHTAGVVCGLDNWFRWTVEERRPFPCSAAVVARVDWLLDALPAALGWLAEHGAIRV